jgi:hypothetical protein
MIVRITRVKVGNRQAPPQQTETPPRKGGVSAFTQPEKTGEERTGKPPSILDHPQRVRVARQYIYAFAAHRVAPTQYTVRLTSRMNLVDEASLVVSHHVINQARLRAGV